jgi:vacuolar-type H+-ATPase subunit H
MEQQEAINQIKTQEQVAQKIIEEAHLKASSLIKEAKFTQRKERLKLAQEQAHKQIQQIKEEFQRKTQAGIQEIERETKQQSDKTKDVAAKNKDRAIDYIVHEVLKKWPLLE